MNLKNKLKWEKYENSIKNIQHIYGMSDSGYPNISIFILYSEKGL